MFWFSSLLPLSCLRQLPNSHLCVLHCILARGGVTVPAGTPLNARRAMQHALSLVLTELSGSLIPTYNTREPSLKTLEAIDSLLFALEEQTVLLPALPSA